MTEFVPKAVSSVIPIFVAFGWGPAYVAPEPYVIPAGIGELSVITEDDTGRPGVSFLPFTSKICNSSKDVEVIVVSPVVVFKS